MALSRYSRTNVAEGFSLDKEHDRYKTEGDNHVLPYERDEN